MPRAATGYKVCRKCLGIDELEFYFNLALTIIPAF